MDLLSQVAQVTKKKETYFQLAESLARKAKTLEKLENLMSSDSRTLVGALRDKEVRFDEYSRSLIDKTLVSALAAVCLGSGGSSPRARIEQAWPTIIGDILTHLVRFIEETRYNLDSGILLLGDTTLDFEELNPLSEGLSKVKRKLGVTWSGLLSRVKRYLVTPAYSFFCLGEQLVKKAQGHKEMRRVAIRDGKTCQDCKQYANAGWQPIGNLPMPGRQCICYDRCRCLIEYR